jgi:hypothetical protein
MEGWVSIYRSLTDKDLWLKEKFTKGQAWVDLIMLANHKDGFVWKRGNKVNVKRGQVGWSELALSARWRWSRNKTTRFLKWLENEQQIIQQRSRITTLITVVNYDKYQNGGKKMIQQKIQQKDNRTSKTIQQKNINNNDNKRNNGKNNIYTEILDFWNSREIVQHKSMDDTTRGKTNSLLEEGYTLVDIKKAIHNYSVILFDDQYYFKYRWTLKDFLQRGFEKFKSAEVAHLNYLRKELRDDEEGSRR